MPVISIILSDQSSSYEAVLGNFLTAAIADTMNDRVLAQQAAAAAALSSSSASASSSAASASASTATSSASAASSSSANAAASATSANTAASSAGNSASSASTSASNAGTFSSNASGSATLAQAWASQSAGTVDGTSYSAKYYAQVAQSAAASISTPIPIASGGTGATSASAALAALGAAALAGAGFTGNVGLSLAGPVFTLNDTSSTSYPQVLWQKNGVQQWGLIGDFTANALTLNRYNSSGSYVDKPISIDNATGIITWSQTPVHPTPATADNSTKSATTGYVVAKLASPTPIGSSAPSSGAFTTLSATSTVSGAGFANYLAAPPAIGGTTPNSGAFTTLNLSGTLGLLGNTAAPTYSYPLRFTAGSYSPFIRGNNSGGIEVLNSANTAINASVSDAGVLAVRTAITVGESTNYSKVTLKNFGNSLGVAIQYNASTDGAVIGQFYNASAVLSGSIAMSGSTTAYNTSSDYRIKSDYTAIPTPLDEIDRIKFYRGKMRGSGSQLYDYVLAHELQEVMPNAVTGEKDAMLDEWTPIFREGFDPDNVLPGDVIDVVQSEALQGVDYSKLIPLFGAAIQELRAEVAQLKSQLSPATS